MCWVGFYAKEHLLWAWAYILSCLEFNLACILFACYSKVFFSKSHLIRVCMYLCFQAICVIDEFDRLY